MSAHNLIVMPNSFVQAQLRFQHLSRYSGYRGVLLPETLNQVQGDEEGGRQ